VPRFKPASSNITHQALDGEVVAIDFEKGIYFHLCGAAGPAFDALASGIPSDQLPSLFTGAPADASGKLATLTQRCIDEGLLAVADASAPSTTPLPTPIPWVEPSFESYTNMQQLLLADPIHDVGDQAWPKQPGSP
jgi:hypothetical protein